MPRGADPLVYVMTAWTGHVHAHDAPAGWSYPTECRAEQDRREVADNAIGEEHEG
ncbi:hypothetical protein [Mesorhizobium kowhaii]|uniref:hypothetical protein n=1 Tax=Mesorhizobium kowhaii TaxID=1300272 RepID=UPI00142DF423|nr:hypothetical protein [Mesorhizobium kowhaii]